MQVLERETRRCGASAFVRWPGRAVLWAVLCASMLTAAPAWAQDAATQQAKEHFDDGQNLYLQGKFEEAAEKFRAAFALKAYPAFIFNAAVCYEKDKDYQKALEFYERFLDADPHSRDHDLVTNRIAAIRKYLNPPTTTTQPTTQPAQPKLPVLPPVRTKGLVVIESNPEGAAIYLKDKSNGIFTRTPYTGSLPPGQHTLLLELKEYRGVRKTVLVRHDRLTYLYFALTPQRNLGWIEVKGNIPGASVYFDKRSFGAVGRTPYSGYLRPGDRAVIVERPGYEPFLRNLKVVAGKTHVVDFRLTPVRHGWVKVTGKTTHGATVLVDDKAISCHEYPCQAQILPGKHKVRVERDGFKSYETDFSVGRTEEIQVAVRLNPKPSRIQAYVTFGVAAVLAGAGIAAGVYSSSRKNSLEEDLANGVIFDTSDGRFTQGKIAAIAANSLFALSGVAAALGTYYLFRNVGPDSYGEIRTRKVSVSPLLGPRLAGVGGAVRF